MDELVCLYLSSCLTVIFKYREHEQERDRPHTLQKEITQAPAAGSEACLCKLRPEQHLSPLSPLLTDGAPDTFQRADSP